MVHEIEIVIKGKAGAGKTAMAGVVTRHLRAVGCLSTRVIDGFSSEAAVFDQTDEVVSKGYLHRVSIVVRTEKEKRMEEKTLNNSNINQAKDQVKDIEVFGDGDMF